jgi:hypothetical protein
MSTTTVLPPAKSGIEEFIQLFRIGYEAWVKAGKILADMLDEDPTIIDQICDEYPEIPPKLLRGFERVGREGMDPRLLIATDGLTSALAKMPPSQQKRYLDGEPVKVVVETETGTDTLLVKVKDLTREQREQALDEMGNVSESRQKAWLADRREKALIAPIVETHARLVAGKKVELPAGRYSAKQLRQIIKDMEDAFGH